ncbi:MAG: HD domain-containing protein [Proteobacteria bacterium]|nr:HD domain-containing protein [Pseudomonadota bacterium]MBU1612535.1 HD domain-containing protein [Pseudomonadota bacterium]
MSQPFKDAIGFCKTIMRNGFDAYVINARLQKVTLEDAGAEMELDISTEMDIGELSKHFPTIQPSTEEGIIGSMKEGGVTYYFHQGDKAAASHPEECVSRMTPRLLKELEKRGEIPLSAVCPWIPGVEDAFEGFADFSEGQVRVLGIPDQALKRDYLLAVRIMRFSANFNLPVEANTWMAVIKGARRVLDYVSISDIMDEWRKVEAESMWQFVQMLFDSQLMHGILPEVAALSRVKQIKNPEEGEETVLAHTIEVMRHYPEELPYDWYGTLACLFHDVGKLYTAEYDEGHWTFYQHHRVGARVTRKILTRLRFPQQDIDLVVELVRNHMRPHFMLTDRGIRRFKSLDEYPRIIEMVRADIKARNGNYRELNHNLKMLDRADLPEEIMEPLLNGNEIMRITELKPGPAVGIIRDALLKAQIAGDVSSSDEARAFALSYKEREQL